MRPQTAPPPDPIPIAQWKEGTVTRELELVDLVPPFRLTGGLWACKSFLALIETGKIQRSRRSIEKWIKDPRERTVTHNRRQTMFDQSLDLLQGRSLEEAEAAYADAYRAYLQTDAGVAATRLVLAGIRASRVVALLHLPVASSDDIRRALAFPT